MRSAADGTPLHTMLKRTIRRQPLACFLVVTFAFTWALHLPVFMFGMGPSWLSWGLITIGALGPLIGAGVAMVAQGTPLRGWLRTVLRVRVAAKWYLAAVGIPVLVVVLASGLFAGFGYRLSAQGFIDLGPAFALQVPLLILFEAVVGGGKEELGWRGFAQPLLQRRFTALTAALVIGGVWAFWHLPLFFSPAAPHSRWPLGQQLLWGVSIMGFSVILAWLFNNTRSAWLAMLMHGSINVTSMLIPIDPAYVHEPVYGHIVIAAMIASVAAVGFVAAVLVMRYGAGDLAAGVRADAATGSPDTWASPDSRTTIGSRRAP